MKSDVGDLHALEMFVADLFNSGRRLEAENLFLPHQVRHGCDLVPLSAF
jgi:hypothetical protein